MRRLILPLRPRRYRIRRSYTTHGPDADPAGRCICGEEYEDHLDKPDTTKMMRACRDILSKSFAKDGLEPVFASARSAFFDDDGESIAPDSTIASDVLDEIIQWCNAHTDVKDANAIGTIAEMGKSLCDKVACIEYQEVDADDLDYPED